MVFPLPGDLCWSFRPETSKPPEPSGLGTLPTLQSPPALGTLPALTLWGTPSPGDTAHPVPSPQSPSGPVPILCPHLMVWLMMMGSGCCRSPASFMGISEKRMRTQLKIWGASRAFGTHGRVCPHLCSQVGHPQAGGTSQSPGKGHNQSLEGLWRVGRGFSQLNEVGICRYLAEVAVAVDELLLMAVLQFVVFDVEPQGLHDAGPGLGVHPQQPGQPWVQLVLGGLWGQPGSAVMEKPSQNKAQPLTHPRPVHCMPAAPGTAEGMGTPPLSGQPVPVFNSLSMKKFLLLPKEEALGSAHSPLCHSSFMPRAPCAPFDPYIPQTLIQGPVPVYNSLFMEKFLLAAQRRRGEGVVKSGPWEFPTAPVSLQVHAQSSPCSFQSLHP